MYRDPDPDLDNENETLEHRDQPIGVFVPFPLPPSPTVVMSGDMLDKFAEAITAIGGLNTLSSNLPNADLLSRSYLRKEAVLSSQIAGIQASIHDLFMLESGQQPDDDLLDDAQETINYLNAMRYATEHLEDGAPIDVALIQGLNRRLLQNGRGNQKHSGQFEDRQNYITLPTEHDGFTPHSSVGSSVAYSLPVSDCMEDLVRYIAGDTAPQYAAHHLVTAGAVQAQFEINHPFRDGNGRIARIIVLLMLLKSGILSAPNLCLSLRLKNQRTHYAELLNQLKSEGDWEAWFQFFFKAVKDAANAAIASTTRLSNLFAADRARIEQTGRRRFTALQVHDILIQQPYIRINDILTRTHLSRPGAAAGIATLVRLGIVRETTGYVRNRIFAYQNYVQILATGTEPLES